jgi:hypothetical protein
MLAARHAVHHLQRRLMLLQPSIIIPLFPQLGVLANQYSGSYAILPSTANQLLYKLHCRTEPESEYGNVTRFSREIYPDEKTACPSCLNGSVHIQFDISTDQQYCYTDFCQHVLMNS